MKRRNSSRTLIVLSLMAAALPLLLLLCLSDASQAQSAPPDTPQPVALPAQAAALPAPDHDCSDGYCVFEVAASADDAGPQPAGCAFSVSTKEVYFGRCDTGVYITTGLRFPNVAIAPGTTIERAYLLFTVDGPYTVPLTVNLYGEDSVNAQPFSASSQPVSRTRLGVSPTGWQITDRWWSGQYRQTPDVAAIVQAIVDKPGWQSGNALAILAVTADTGLAPGAHRRVFAWDREKNTDNTARLVIWTRLPFAGRIYFSSDRDGNWEVYAMSADGSGQTNLTWRMGNDGDPQVSPDGRQVVFECYQGDEAEICRMDVDGGNWVTLTNNTADDWWPSWSPDGKRIVFSSDRDGDHEIYVMNADGSGVMQLTSNTAYDSEPRWSPNGSYIAFVSDRDTGGATGEIYRMNANGSSQTRLTNNTIWDWAPSWSPDSQTILFTRSSGDDEIYRMNYDGTGQTNLTNYPGSDDYEAVYSPDGRFIAFTSEDRDGNEEIYVMNADGSRQVNLTRDPADDWCPHWGVWPYQVYLPAVMR